MKKLEVRLVKSEPKVGIFEHLMWFKETVLLKKKE